MSFAEGENIGPYRIIEQLGQGGMATVYKAYHASLDRYVALKVLHPAFHEDRTFTGRFQREARVVAKLEHPNIVPVYDFAEHEKRPYLVMKFIEGDTLKARLGRGPLTTDEINRVVDSVGSALAYAHRQGILHRDIKPSNVLIAKDGQMYLADFGLARIAQAGESTLSSDSIMGTPQYISPEQARGDKDLDEGTDIYSFGVMLYELVVGQVPFSADTPFSIIHDHIYTPLPLPRSVNAKVPESVERVLLKSLAKDRDDRYEDIPAMVKAFTEAWTMAGVPAQGTAVTLPVVTQKKGTVSEKTERAEVKIEAAKEPVKPKKKRTVWPYLAAGVLLALCCLFVLVAVRNNWDGQLASGRQQEPTATQFEEPEPIEPKPQQPSPEPALELPRQILEAQRRVDENPNDPAAHVDLALAFWDAGRQRQAYEALNEAANKPGLDAVFFIDTGNKFRQREAWIASAAMYLRAIKIISPEPPPDEVFIGFHESVYKAAPQAEFEVTYPMLEEIARLDQPIALVAQARHSYYNGRLDDGRVFLNQVKRLKPDLYEAALLEAEFAVTEERFEEARLVLGPLIANLDAPEWIRIMAEDLNNRIP